MKYKCRDCDFKLEIDYVRDEDFKKILDHEKTHEVKQ